MGNDPAAIDVEWKDCYGYPKESHAQLVGGPHGDTFDLAVKAGYYEIWHWTVYRNSLSQARGTGRDREAAKEEAEKYVRGSIDYLYREAAGAIGTEGQPS